eukprot:CAMPEP_0194747310 /NCGR_PEP_ID=MMETSP0323_2-20130528/1377_1 /TAXON_ID=2866 ORGANISM="Crypthecodinium cohnii, Strain Seligo" /NCGR_SAMPLE_ID=MMETSP0323_2 /ASSEMBLY_ACC=CAM_ASM_000346 /LENGTH=130 /DNA_ID=CAMNT_0039660537 /DNA_START=124 /DNA_END=517 /DNA_ORIENTATION=+
MQNPRDAEDECCHHENREQQRPEELGETDKFPVPLRDEVVDDEIGGLFSSTASELLTSLGVASPEGLMSARRKDQDANFRSDHLLQRSLPDEDEEAATAAPTPPFAWDFWEAAAAGGGAAAAAAKAAAAA